MTRREISDQTEERVELDVYGMTCASCAARIQKKLNRHDGIEASVNYATQKAHILAPTWQTEDLIEIIRNAGYDAHIPQPVHETIDPSQRYKRRLIVCATLALPVIVTAMITSAQFPGWQWVSWILATPVVTWGALPFHRATWINARHRTTTMDTLISLGTSAAYLWSTICLFFGEAGHIRMRHEWTFSLTHDHHLSSVYFEACVGIIVFTLLGRFIESRSRSDAAAALKALAEVGAKSVTVVRDGHQQHIPIESLRIDDVFIVLPGQKIATDGVVVQGQSAVDNSIITGESLPVEVGEGDQVVGASLNTYGHLLVRARAIGADTQLAQISRLVERAQQEKSRSQALADSISSIFVPGVIALSVFTCLIWVLSSHDVTFAITAAVTVLIISCPCALGLATPTAILAGSLRGSRLGIIIRGPQALEDAHRIQTIAMDKTGTITTGEMNVSEIICSQDSDREELLRYACALESHSDHPIAKAITRYCSSHDIEPVQISSFTNLPGRGVQALCDGYHLTAGGESLLSSMGYEIPPYLSERVDKANESGASVVYIAREKIDSGRKKVIGALMVRDEVAEGSIEAIKRLQAMDIEPVMMTGDNDRVARYIAGQVGISQVYSQVLPHDKFSIISSLQGKDHVPVAMIGDGVNDAAALSQADLGIAMGTGSDAAIASSDLTLMRHDLRLAADAIALSRRIRSTIRMNLFWAFAYNICAIPIAAFGYLTPMLAGAAMAFSSLFVVSNSWRLRSWTP